jgi:hypothetical protein
VHPLEGVWAKLDRGDEHVVAYEREEGLYTGREKPPPVEVAFDINEETGRGTLLFSRVEHPPLRLGIIVGDAVHAFRSALDQLVFELAFMDSGGRTFDKAAFPGSDNPSSFNGSYVQRTMLGGLTATHRTQLKRFQPYRQPSTSERPSDPRLLLDLSNDDKHRVVQPGFLVLQEFESRIVRLWDCAVDPNGTSGTNEMLLGRPLESQTEIGHTDLLILGPQPTVQVYTRVKYVVCFRNGVPASDALREIGAFARNVVEFFAPDFERPKSLRQRHLPRHGRIKPLEVVEALYGSGTYELGTHPPQLARPSPSKG